MINEKKIKTAFTNIGKDIEHLRKEIEVLHTKQNRVIKKEIGDYSSLLQEIKVLSEENKTRINALASQNKDTNELQEQLKQQEKNIDSIHKKIETLEKSFDSSTIDNKFQPQIQKLSSKIDSLEQSLASMPQHSHIEQTVASITELLQEKIDMELNSLRYEMTEELGKIYDICLNDTTSSSSKKSPPKKPKLKQQKKEENPSKIKKVASWFLQDEEDDVSAVKREVKK